MDSPLPVEPYGDAAVRQRARAEARASFARVGARTEPERLFETGGLRWRFPRSSTPCEAAIVNTGGGVAGGDSYSVSLTLSEGAEVEATTPSAERIYRSDGPAAAITTRLVLKPRARLFWLPQETLMFEGARLERPVARQAGYIMAETLVFGASRAKPRSTRVRLMARAPDGHLVFAEKGSTTPARPLEGVGRVPGLGDRPSSPQFEARRICRQRSKSPARASRQREPWPD
jgi:urease accessory protein